MNREQQVQALEWLKKLQWKGQWAVTAAPEEGEEDFYDPCDSIGTVAACPECHGLAPSLPDKLTVGDDFSGYVDVPLHEDHKTEIGHRSYCKLDAFIRELEDVLSG